nr:terpenoids synthase [Blumea balsamifera]
MVGFQKHSCSTQVTEPIIRRSANYPPSRWSYEVLQSVTNNYVGEKYKITSNNLKERVRMMISKDTAMKNPLSMLELVDDLQRLGVSYHFKDEISNVLKMIYSYHYEAHNNWNTLDLNLKALGFRLLRQHGYHIPQEIFKDITDESGNIKASVQDDFVAMLNLYEASFYAVDDENIMDEAREFTRKCLKEKLEKNNIVNKSIMMLISHALEHPLLFRIPRFESVWFIEAYKTRDDMIPLLLEFAVLDYNILQGIHQEDLKHVSKWWVGLHWIKNLEFARDSMVECFSWSVGANPEPSFSVLRRNMTKNLTFTSVLDDVYDVYGTLDELEQFTEAVRRWDMNAAEGLPDYMRICFMGLYNTINEMAYNTFINHKSFVIPYLRKVWTEFCEANLQEARWYYSGYIPTFEEYLKTSVITVAVPVIVLAAYFLEANDLSNEAFDNVIHSSAIILRLTDDQGTSEAELARGDVPKSVQCYMNETGASRNEAIAYMKRLIINAHKTINKERMACKSPTLQIFMECATNLGRIGHVTYDHGDMFGVPDDSHQSHHNSLLLKPKT